MSHIYLPTGGSGNGLIPEYTVDPTPVPQSPWVLKTGSGGSGGGKYKIQLGVFYTTPNTGGSTTYKFSYPTLESNIKRVTLT